MRRVILLLALPTMAVAFSPSVSSGFVTHRHSLAAASPAVRASVALRAPAAARISGGALAASMSDIQVSVSSDTQAKLKLPAPDFQLSGAQRVAGFG